MTYEGQPEYVRAGFLCDLFEVWVEQALPEDEWGRLVEAWWGAGRAEISAGGGESGYARQALDRVQSELDRAFAEDWWGMREDYEDGIRLSQEDYDRIVEYWRERAKHFKSEAALEDEIAKLPAWVRPNPEAAPLPDPERAEYERLRKKFSE